MTIQSEESRVQYSGNGSSSTPYPIPFEFHDNSHLVVIATDSDGNEVPLGLGTDFFVTGAGISEGGELITSAAYDNSFTLTIYRELPYVQETDYEPQDSFPADTHEKALDTLTMLIQQVKRLTDQSFRVSPASQFPTEVPVIAANNTLMGFDAAGEFDLKDATALQELLNLSGTVIDQPLATWADDISRAVKAPDYSGQLGVQTDDQSMWISTGMEAGDWQLAALDEDNMASDSERRPVTQQSLSAFVADAVAMAIPVGVVSPFAGAAAPAGWLMCDGQQVSRTTYAELFSAIATTYGIGDGSTTFNLPDLRGRVAAGKDDMGGIAASRLTNSGTGNPGIDGTTLGGAGGVDRHQLTVGQIPSHTHALNNATEVWRNIGSNPGFGTGGPYRTDFDITANNTGGDEAHPNVQPTLVLNYIIKF